MRNIDEEIALRQLLEVYHSLYRLGIQTQVSAVSQYPLKSVSGFLFAF